MNINTKILHDYPVIDPVTGASSIPKYQTSTFHQKNVFTHTGFSYTRFGNPTVEAAEKCIASLENAQFGLAFSSGMAAINAVLFLLSKGDHLVLGKNIYGGTFQSIHLFLARFGIDCTFVDETDIDSWQKAIKKETKMVFIESPSNPLLRVTDIQAATDIARKHDLISVVDNTFMSPYFQNPLALGADIVLHSASKYIGGHSDVIAGLVVTDDEDLAERIGFIQNSTGGVLGPQDSYLLIRGIKTLALRMDQVSKNAVAVTNMLVEHPKVEVVYHPSLKDHPNHDIQERQASGHTGVVSFVVPDVESAKAVIKNTKYFTLAESLGAVESLISVPALMTHASIPKDIREKEGIADGLVRLSVGIEDTDDLVADLKQALDQLA